MLNVADLNLPTEHLAIIPFVKRAGLTEALRGGQRAMNVQERAIDSEREILEAALSRRLQSGRIIEATFKAWGYDDGSGLLATSANTEGLEKGIMFFLERCYPAVIVPALSSTDLCSIIRSAQEREGWTIVNRRSVGYPRGERGARTERRHMSFVELLQEFSDHGRLLENSRFVCSRPDGEAMDVYLSRRSIARLYQGDLSSFAVLFVEPIRQRAVRKYGDMRGRSKSVHSPYGRPLTIRFGTPLLAERTELERLCTVLSRMRDASVCVFHLNPHLHLAVLDYADDGSLDICMTGPSSLRIIPGYQTSEASLLRVCDTIAGGYAEATLEP